MIRRRSKKKKCRVERAIASGDEPPDPITLTILAVAGTVIGATGTVFGAVSASKSAKQQAALAEANSAASARDAQFARQQAAYNEARARERAARIRGSQRAAIGASGVDFSGSPLDLLSETAVQSELEAQQIRAEGAYRASGFDFEASGQRYRAQAYRSQGSTALTNGLLSAGGQLVAGATNATLNYRAMTKPGSY